LPHLGVMWRWSRWRPRRVAPPWKRKRATAAEVELERGSPVAVVEGEEAPPPWLCHASPRARVAGLPPSAAATRGGDEEEERGVAAARVEEMGPVRRRMAKSRWARVPRHRARRIAGRRVDSPDGTKRKGGASARRQAGTVLLQLEGRIEVGERSATPSRTKVERGAPRLGCIGAEHRGARCRTRRSQPEETNHSRRPAPSVLPPGCGRAAGLPFLCPGVAGIACRRCLDSLGGQAARCPRRWRC
jgi:hypothetical protein